MTDVYNEQIQDLSKILPTFKVANATIHYDETSPHMHVVGVPVIENCTRGMKKQVGKSQLFTKTLLSEIQDKMRNACIKSYNKFYDVDSRLKTKQKGRNQDINVKENIITKLQEEKASLKAQLQKFKGFWHNLMSHFHKRITYDNNQNYKIVSDDLYKNGIFDNNDNEIANNILRKVTIPDENKTEKNRKKNNDTRF